MTSSRLDKLKEFVRKNPDGAFARYGLAMEYRGLRQWDMAVATFADLMERHPDYAPAFLQYGATLQEMGRIEEAAEVFKRGIQVCQAQGETHAYEELEQAYAQLAPNS